MGGPLRVSPKPPLVNPVLAEAFQDVNACFDRMDWEGAEPRLMRLLRLGYPPAPIFQSYGTVLTWLGRIPEAIASYRQALAIDPSLIHSRDNMIMLLDASPDTTAEEAQIARRAWWRQHGELLFARRRPHFNDHDPNRPLRVGYVSGDLRHHSMAYGLAQLICGHMEGIQAYCYSTLPVEFEDGATKELFRVYTNFQNVAEVSEKELAEQIRRDQIDILVDLSGYTAGNRLQTFCRKPAPIQITAWGYALGVGWPAMDVLLADEIILPPARQREYCEQVVYLPTVIPYECPPGLPGPSELPCLTRPPTFGAYHRPLKLNVAVLALWRCILGRVPESRLLIRHENYSEAMRAWIRRELGPTSHQVEFAPALPHDKFMESYDAIDITLDAFPQTGGISTSEGLWMGVPTLTLLGERMIQRASASLLSAVGLPQFITTTSDQYVDEAVAWVTTRRHELNTVRQELRIKMAASPICNGYGDVVEATYRRLWRELWCEQQSFVA